MNLKSFYDRRMCRVQRQGSGCCPVNEYFGLNPELKDPEKNIERNYSLVSIFVVDNEYKIH